MAQLIIIAREYKKRPSEIMGIENTYVAYCFDEAALYITQQAMDEKGVLQWDKLKWTDKKNDNNAALKEFITKGR